MAVTGEVPPGVWVSSDAYFVLCVKAGASCPVQDAEGTLPLFLWLYLPRLVSAKAPQKQWCVRHPSYSSSHGQGISFIKYCVAQRMTVKNKVGKTCVVQSRWNHASWSLWV